MYCTNIWCFMCFHFKYSRFLNFAFLFRYVFCLFFHGKKSTICIIIYIFIYKYLYNRVYMQLDLYIYVYAHTHTYVHTYVYAYLFNMCRRLYACIQIHMVHLLHYYNLKTCLLRFSFHILHTFLLFLSFLQITSLLE